ncbi:tyrosinase cofactor [Streptomyces sp. NBC_01775]|uniref:tyrosinase family oxidase copper chaperone n=1 Tax=Streptomyces sp. NBC_01775 TaxID=2975939 RepID=UPI002DD9D8FE|nr:tyrosinase family oxidase copper chaperone [Streptomyces sp. NBC_01775]WSB75539.1 tyrosinase cofactor [Streptomyces sp. NBC_01775]
MRRRDMVKATTGIAAGVTLTGAAGAVMVSADGSPGEEQAVKSAAAPAHKEKYRGRTIEVTGHEGAEAVRIDGRELHLMKLGEGAYLSSMCHYGFAASPLLAARRAVEELRGADLLPLGHSESHPGGSGRGHGGRQHGRQGKSA